MTPSPAGATTTRPVLAAVGDFKAIGAGYYHTCAIRADDTVTCWGSNHTASARRPRHLQSDQRGGYHTCGIRTDGTVACWGYNDFGDTSPPSGTFKAVSAGGRTPAPSGRMTPSPAGATTTMASPRRLRGPSRRSARAATTPAASAPDDTVACWGDNEYGQANGLPLYSPRPSGAFKAVSAGVPHLRHPDG